MAIKFIDLTDEVSGSLNVDFTRESKRKYIAFFDLADDENFVKANCGLIVGTRHPTDRQQVLLKIEYSLFGSVTWEGDNSAAKLWYVTADYGPWNPAERGDPSAAGNPLAMPPKIRMEYEKVPEPIWEDVNGDPILNPAGEPYDPPIELENLIRILTVRRNEASPNFVALDQLALSINEGVWNGYPEKTVRLAPIALPEVEYSQETEQYFYPMVYVFEINLKNWQRKPLPSGYRELSPTSAEPNRLVVILDDSGQPLQNPGLLDKTGKYLKPPVNKDNLVIGAIDIYPSTDFGVLDMDNLFKLPAVLS